MGSDMAGMCSEREKQKRERIEGTKEIKGKETRGKEKGKKTKAKKKKKLMMVDEEERKGRSKKKGRDILTQKKKKSLVWNVFHYIHIRIITASLHACCWGTRKSGSKKEKLPLNRMQILYYYHIITWMHVCLRHYMALIFLICPTYRSLLATRHELN